LAHGESIFTRYLKKRVCEALPYQPHLQVYHPKGKPLAITLYTEVLERILCAMCKSNSLVVAQIIALRKKYAYPTSSNDTRYDKLVITGGIGER